MNGALIIHDHDVAAANMDFVRNDLARQNIVYFAQKPRRARRCPGHPAQIETAAEAGPGVTRKQPSDLGGLAAAEDGGRLDDELFAAPNGDLSGGQSAHQTRCGDAFHRNRRLGAFHRETQCGGGRGSIDDGFVDPVVGARFPFERAADALNAIDRRQATGKVVLDVVTE